MDTFYVAGTNREINPKNIAVLCDEFGEILGFLVRAEGASEATLLDRSQVDQRPYCELCDTDTHLCLGCGDPVPHGTVACRICNDPEAQFHLDEPME